MPELPELEIVIEVLQRRVVGRTIDDVRLIGGAAIVVRDLVHLGFAAALTGATITRVIRRGKYLVFNLASERQPARGYLALNPKLAQLNASAIACSVVIVAPFDHANPNATSPSRVRSLVKAAVLCFCATCSSGTPMRIRKVSAAAQS